MEQKRNNQTTNDEMTSSDLFLFSPEPKSTQFTVIEEEINQSSGKTSHLNTFFLIKQLIEK